MTASWQWLLGIFLILAGFLGIFLPALPGVPLMYAGMLLAAWGDDFQRIGWLSLTVLGVLTAISVIVDFAASALGAQRVGASRRAIWGAFVGAVIGVFFGLPGLVFGPFLGAVVGELSVHGRMTTAGRVGIGTWLGLIFGTLVKIAIAFSMLGVFVLAYFIG
ncbi:MAG TPA: DUF456 family protein [Steroidobacteraceae bacterium]|nr:DUF456 family protein [Steroidobacteraceae bacterium]